MSFRASSRRNAEEASPSAPARPEGAPARTHAHSRLPVAAPNDSLPAPAQGGVGASARPASTEAMRQDFAKRFAAAYRTLWTIAAGIVNDPTVAEDVVQDAALTALGKLDEFRPESNFTAWMAQIVRYVALNASRRGRRQPAALDPLSMDDSMTSPASQHPPMAVSGEGSAGDARGTPLVDAHGHLSGSGVGAPFDDRVMRALNSVSEIARACLLLRTIEGLNYDEIARALEIPPGTAMSHVHRTRMFLREKLADLDPTRGGHPAHSGAAASQGAEA